jgi:hypothetical protein
MKWLLINFLIGAIVLYVGLLIQREGFRGTSPSFRPPSTYGSYKSNNPEPPSLAVSIVLFVLTGICGLILLGLGVQLIMNFLNSPPNPP